MAKVPLPKSAKGWVVAVVGGLVGLCLIFACLSSLLSPTTKTPSQTADVPERAAAPVALDTPTRVAAIRTLVPATATPIPVPTEVPTFAPTAVNTSTSVPVSGPSASNNANLRAGPGTGFAIAGSVQPGEKLEVVGRSPAGDWLKLATGLWIASRLVNDAPEVPVVEELTAPATTATPIPPTDTPAPPAATPTIKQLIVDALGDRNRPDVPETVITVGADSMAVVFPINDNLKMTWARDVAQRDILNAAQAIYQASGNAYDVTFTGTFAMQDAYGNVEELPVMRATLTRATLDKINWENLLAVQLAQVADAYDENAGFSQ